MKKVFLMIVAAVVLASANASAEDVCSMSKGKLKGRETVADCEGCVSLSKEFANDASKKSVYYIVSRYKTSFKGDPVVAAILCKGVVNP